MVLGEKMRGRAGLQTGQKPRLDALGRVLGGGKGVWVG